MALNNRVKVGLHYTNVAAETGFSNQEPTLPPSTCKHMHINLVPGPISHHSHAQWAHEENHQGSRSGCL